MTRKLRTVVLTLTLVGGTLLTAPLGGCNALGTKDVSAEAARSSVAASDYTLWRSQFGQTL